MESLRQMRRQTCRRSLSVALSTGLTSILDKVEAHTSPLTLLSPRLAIPPFERRVSRDSSRSSGQQEDLETTKLAELPTEMYLIQENEYPSIRSLRTDADIGDGLWLCCYCRHENILRHYEGPFPFKHLCCARCTRKLCSDCHTTEILAPLPYGMISAPRPAPHRQIRYLHVCTSCGLSHRAEMEGTTLDFYGVTCAGCGASSYGDWPRYHIGSNEPYRRDPDAAFATLVERRAEDAARLASSSIEEDTDSCPAESGLSCTNA